MIAQRDGTCRGCRLAITSGSPIFFDKSEGSYHWDCWEAQPQPLWLIDEAERMGYRKFEPVIEIDKDWSF